jgi:mannosyltransferase
VRERRVEVVHAHVARDYPLAALAARADPRARLVITRHLLYPISRLHAFTLRRVARAIAVSGGVARELRAQRLFAADKIRVVPNGVDVGRFERAAADAARLGEYRRGLPTRARALVGVAGELREHKGQEDFVRAAASLAPRFPEADFLVAGEDASHAKAYRARLERLVAELGLAGRVHLLGWLEDVAPFMASLDVFVSPSRVEPFGLVMAEAMAAGAAVVATDTDGAREIIEDGVTGRLVPVGDARALAAAVADLLGDERQRKSLAERARESVRERHSLARMVEETERVYEEALAR